VPTDSVSYLWFFSAVMLITLRRDGFCNTWGRLLAPQRSFATPTVLDQMNYSSQTRTVVANRSRLTCYHRSSGIWDRACFSEQVRPVAYPQTSHPNTV
jgi:hypothetical protein